MREAFYCLVYEGARNFGFLPPKIWYLRNKIETQRNKEIR